MEIQAKVRGMLFKIDEPDTKETFKKLAELHETFGESNCGLCGSEEISPNHRVNSDGDDFYEFKCNKCGARLSMGQTKKDKRLFPIRQLTEEGKPCRKKGKFGKHNGWTRYRGEAAKDDD